MKQKYCFSEARHDNDSIEDMKRDSPDEVEKLEALNKYMFGSGLKTLQTELLDKYGNLRMKLD